MGRASLLVTNFTAGEISPRLEGRVDLSKYFNGCRTLENFLVHPHGGATRRSGLRFVALAGGDGGAEDEPPLLVPFEFSAEQSYVLEFGERHEAGYMRVFKDRGAVLDGEGAVYEIATPYLGADLPQLRWVQSNDVLVLVHPAYAPRKLTRAGHADWSLEVIEFTGAPEDWSDEDGWPSVACFFEERLVLGSTTDRPNTLWFSRSGDYFDLRTNTREVPLEDWDDNVLADGSGDGTTDGRAGDTFTLLDGLWFEKNSVVKGRNADGERRYWRYLGSRSIDTAGADIAVGFAAEPGAHQLEVIYDAEGALNGEFWEELAVGDRIENPEGDEPLDDDGIELTLSAAEAGGIRFLVPRSRLWVGAVGGEWTITGTGTGGAITPSEAKAGLEGTAGSASARPVAVGAGTLFIQRAGRKLREMAYRFESDAFVSRDLTILSEHITAPGLTELAYVQEPDSVVYGLRADGALVCLTYEPDQEVYAWSRLVTDGAVESICAVYDAGAGRDVLWLEVRREAGGVSRRTVEFLEGEFDGDLGEAFFVDSGLSFRREAAEAAVTAFGGLEHLAGATVSVLADGAVHPDVVVDADGGIELDRPARVVHVGLPFVSTLRPMRLEGASPQRTDQTKNKRLVEVAVRFHQTLGGEVGPDGGALDPVYYRTSAMPMGASPELFSGDRVVKFSGGWNRDGQIRIEQRQPLPMTVLLLVPQVVINE